ncbi:MAG: SulP family inorganic anion transporter, partial [Caldilineaceae bacterium]
MDSHPISAEATPLNPFARTQQPAGLARWLPGLAQIRSYKRAWLAQDLVAGIVLTAILVPVGMGYASAAGLPPIYGLYATIVPLLAYALFGPSRILVLGPDSSLDAIIAATIVPLAAGDADRLVALAGVLALLSGALCILVGLAHFGFITDLLSKPIRMGYLNGIALTVVVGQLPKILGFSAQGETLVQEAFSLVQGVAQGLTNPVSLAIGLVCLAIVLLFKQRWPRIPGVLVAVVGATLVSGLLDLATTAGISVVGPLPQGLPGFQVPRVNLEDIAPLLAGAFAIALVSFADTSVLSRTFALRGGYQVDQNQELVALGAANIAAGLFQGFSISSSSSRTPVAESAGAKTQLTGVVGAICIALLLVFAPNLLQSLPNAALGAVVIAS